MRESAFGSTGDPQKRLDQRSLTTTPPAPAGNMALRNKTLLELCQGHRRDILPHAADFY
jgi:hypothetical protein